ncbi:MAG: hypothetical protein WD205_09480, partial [Rhodothermales bacterium]
MKPNGFERRCASRRSFSSTAPGEWARVRPSALLPRRRGRYEEHFSEWLERRLGLGLDVENNVGRALIRQAGPRTQDIVQVARQHTVCAPQVDL